MRPAYLFPHSKKEISTKKYINIAKAVIKFRKVIFTVSFYIDNVRK